MAVATNGLSPRVLFRVTAFGEAVTWTLLLTALLVRALVETPPAAMLPIVGSLHGFVFLSYCVVAILVGINQRWRVDQTLLAVILAIVPFATIPYELRLVRNKRLEGPWRTEPSDNPQDKTWFDKLFRWFIKNPALLILVLAVAVVVIFVTLLWLGPPDQWGNR
jgi:integral membrane protein